MIRESESQTLAQPDSAAGQTIQSDEALRESLRQIQARQRNFNWLAKLSVGSELTSWMLATAGNEMTLALVSFIAMAGTAEIARRVNLRNDSEILKINTELYKREYHDRIYEREKKIRQLREKKRLSN